jgi:hypothetical protein
MIKHIGQIMRPFRRKWLALEPDEQRRLFEVTAAIIRRWQTPRIARALPPWLAIKTYCLEHGLMDELADIVACPARTAYGNPIVVGRRVFARYPHFRDASKIPDRCFEITDRIALRAHVSDVDVVDGTLLVSGHAYLSLLGGSTSLVLQRWPFGPRLEFTTERVATPGLRDHQVAYRRAGFAFAVDLSTAADGRRLPSGTWRILLSVRAGEVSRTAPLRATDVARAARPERGAARAVARGRAGLYLSGSRDVRLRVGRVGRIARWAEAVETAYARLMRRAVTPLLASRWGRLGTLVVAKVRPGSIGRPDE